MSTAIIHNGLVYLSGQVADDTSTKTAGQAQQILSKIDAILAEAGTDKTNILSANIWLADHEDFDALNEVWDAWVVKGQTPARACVESALAFPPYTVEIAVIAAI